MNERRVFKEIRAEMTRLEIALGYARSGFPIFPIAPDTKNPMTTHGFKDATLDLDQVEFWWVKYPEANIAVPTGKASGIWALDIDRKTVDGEETLRRLEIKHGSPAGGLRLNTPTNGGFHLVYTYVEGMRCQTNLKHGYDVRGDGGYILLPGSVIDGKHYVIPPESVGREIPDAPEWLITGLMGQKMTPMNGESESVATQSEKDFELVLTSLTHLSRERADDYNGWIKVGMVLHNLKKGEQMLKLWIEWSSQSPKFVEGDCERRWETFGKNRPAVPLGLGSLVRWAKEDEKEERLRSAENKTVQVPPPIIIPPPRPLQRVVTSTTEKTTKVEKPVVEGTLFQRLTTPVDDTKGMDWPRPEPLDHDHLPPFPIDSFTGNFGAYAKAVSLSTSSAQDLIAMAMLGVAATALARKVRICGNENWSQPLNIYIFTVAKSGERKSEVFRHATRPISEYEEMLAANASKGEPRPMLFAGDSTPEKLSSLMAEHGGRMATFADEGNCVEIMTGRYSQRPNLDVFLKGHAGEEMRIERQKRGCVMISDPALTIIVTVQPVVLEDLNAARYLTEKGLLARFAFAFASTNGPKPVRTPPIPPEIIAAYHATITRLLAVNYRSGEGMAGKPHFLHLCPEAQARFEAYWESIEMDRQPGRRLSQLEAWSAKLHGTVLRVIGLLHGVEHAQDGKDFLGVPVSLGTVERAIAIGEYIIPHAMHAFELIGSDAHTAGARHVLRWLIANGRGIVTQRSMHQAVKHTVGTIDKMAPILNMLVEYGILRRMPNESAIGRAGRPKSPEFRVNPYILQEGGVITEPL